MAFFPGDATARATAEVAVFTIVTSRPLITELPGLVTGRRVEGFERAMTSTQGQTNMTSATLVTWSVRVGENRRVTSCLLHGVVKSDRDPEEVFMVHSG